MHHPDLAGLLTGDLDSAEAVAAGVHLEQCAQCRAELVEVAVGHGLLRRSARTLGGTPRSEDQPTLPRAPAPPRGPRRPLLAVAAAAAVVGVLVGGAVTAVVTQRTDPPGVAPAPTPSPSPSPVTTAPLEPYGAAPAGVRGEVELYDTEPGHTRVRIRTGDLSPTDTTHFYYAWLLDPETQKMLPLGQLGPEGGSFDVADSILAAYSAVDVSLEADDGDPGHSVTSVLRGDL